MEDLSNDCMTAKCFEAVWTMKRNCLEPRAVLEVSFAFCHRVVNEAFSRSLVSSGDVYAKGAYRATLWPTKEWRDWIVSMLLELSLLLASLTGTPLRPCHIESRSDQTNRQTHWPMSGSCLAMTSETVGSRKEGQEDWLAATKKPVPLVTATCNFSPATHCGCGGRVESRVLS